MKTVFYISSASSHLSVLQGSWYRPPVLSLQFGRSWYGPGKGKADNHQVCQSKRCRSNHPGSAHRSSPWWSVSTHTHLKQRERSVTITHTSTTHTHTCLYVSLFFFSRFGFDTNGPQRVSFSPRPAECAVSLTIIAATPYKYSTPQHNLVRKHSPQPTVESRRQLNSPRL